MLPTVRPFEALEIVRKGLVERREDDGACPLNILYSTVSVLELATSSLLKRTGGTRSAPEKAWLCVSESTWGFEWGGRGSGSIETLENDGPEALESDRVGLESSSEAREESDCLGGRGGGSSSYSVSSCCGEAFRISNGGGVYSGWATGDSK